MSVAFVIAEYRGQNKSAVMERIEGEWDDAYRITVSRRYSSPAKAKAAFLSEIPPRSKERYEKQITDASK